MGECNMEFHYNNGKKIVAAINVSVYILAMLQRQGKNRTGSVGDKDDEDQEERGEENEDKVGGEGEKNEQQEEKWDDSGKIFSKVNLLS